MSPDRLRPPFHHESAVRRTRAIEDDWNQHDAERAALCCAEDARWRDGAAFLRGREAIEAFLRDKFAREGDFRVIREMWAFDGERIAARFCAEWRNAAGGWFRAYGVEAWQFEADGLIRARHASAQALPLAPQQRKFLWPPGPRPLDHPGLAAFGM